MAEPEDIHARKPSGVNIFGISGSGYHHLMPHEMADLDKPSPEAKMSPPETPHSFHNLLGGHQPAGSSSSSPRVADSQGMPEPYSQIWAPSMPRGGDEKKSDMPRTMEREVKMSEGGKLPKIVEPRGDAMDDEFDDEIFYKKFVYSTVGSGIWLVTAILQPRWGHKIASGASLSPSTATTLAALLAKTIEMSFVTVFVSCLGQVLTRRAFIRKANGMSLAEMTMRNWVIQPGSLITHFETLPSSSLTLLGMLSLTATIAAAFYTTASDAMVSPKLKSGSWEHKELIGYVRASYANAAYVREDCPYLFNITEDIHAAESCMNVQFSGQSYRNLLNYMNMWTSLNQNGTEVSSDMKKRPGGTTLLHDNTTLYSSWIETEHGDVKAHFEETGRIINNVTLALPHPGVYGASTLKLNGILQPDDLAGVGEYTVRAGVVSPSVNVLCVDMDKKELAPLVYTTWPNAKVNNTDIPGQKTGWPGWTGEVPQPLDGKNKDYYLNRTDVDDIFRWGPKYERRPPVFQMYPFDFNLLTNATVYAADAIYTLGKSPESKNYTVCQLRSWVSPNCSTEFNISGIAGATMKAHCEDDADENAYRRSFPSDQGWSAPSLDWKWLADQWRLSMDLNGGSVNNNASNARILTQLALHEPKMPASYPSLAEALAVYSSPLIMISAIGTPFRHYWDQDPKAYPENLIPAPGFPQPFNASLITQEYTSGHTQSWQNIFYVILVLVFAINLFCLGYFIMRSGLVTDFTEPQNLFSLAINSPPSKSFHGSCGGGPEKRHLVVPWKVAYAPSANHYFFQDNSPGKETSEGLSTAREYGEPRQSHRAFRLIAESSLPNIFDHAMEPTGATYVLTAAQFAGQVNQPGGDPVQRQAQVERGLASFEQAKKQMREDMVGELHRYLESGKWIQSSQNASGHTAYKRFMGKSGYTHSLHYGHFFVIQAIYVQGGGHIHDAIFNMYQAISGYWDMTITPDKPFYPRLADSQRERRLILGIIQGPNTPSGRQATSDKHRELGVYLRAAAQLTAQIQNEEQVEKERSMDFQRTRDELRHAQQRNLELQQELQEGARIRRDAERNEQALRHQLKQKSDQLQDAQAQLQEANHKLVESKRHVQAYGTHHQQISTQIAELEKQHARVEGSKSATKRPAAGIAGGEEPKRRRQN
ncbi:uncharacterized protein FSUBG_102 [Fusarium subglutinans]|uniref:Uncharacterized protein n=1 Tax=Gibberella subglutinans TaxID=42677 RepID=A0A8H5V7Q1_GIBSU|nr:uncharacterized protein FSUBG_102 [Fusarium subglutinans]KAF5614222.1 hypothetical protein FSUBG_102 [Fusarium subglutinans]